MDGSELASIFFTSAVLVGAAMCSASISAVHMTAGHNAFRGSGPGQKNAFDNALALVGCAGKPVGIDGSRVEEMVLCGQIEEVARYCETDVLNTYRVWLVYELFRGAITSEQLDWSERQIREFVANRKFTNIHLLAALGIVVEEPTVQTDVTAP